jgi:uncharacterized protein YggE
MNIKYRISFWGILLFSALTTFGQVGGNQVFNREYRERPATPQSEKIFLTDSTFFIRASVLKNVISDSYVATFGVAESAKTLKEANTRIDDRIQKFISALKKIGVQHTDIYVDITTQTRILDYKINDNYAEQFISGFEQKKNVIVKFKNIKDLDKMVIAASEFEIYDLIKVDYIVDDPDKIYTQLFQTAMELLNNKKDLYVKTTNIKLKKSPKISSESFYYLTPPKLYQSYTPGNISTDYNDYSSNRKKKTLQINTTYYYDNIDYSTFDKVINPIITEPAVEFILLLQLKFDIEKE